MTDRSKLNELGKKDSQTMLDTSIVASDVNYLNLSSDIS